MALTKIKKQFLHKRVAFGNSAAPLGQRTDIDDLAILALESKDPTLLMLFESLPDLQALKKTKTDAQLKKVASDAGSKKK